MKKNSHVLLRNVIEDPENPGIQFQAWLNPLLPGAITPYKENNEPIVVIPLQKSQQRFICFLISTTYFTNIIYLGTDLTQRSRSTDQIFAIIFDCAPQFSPPVFWTIHCLGTVLVGISCATFTSSSVSMDLTKKWDGQSGWKGFFSAFIGDDAQKKPFTTMAFFITALSISMSSILLLETWVKPHVSKDTYNPLYFSFFSLFTLFGIMYYFLFSFREVMSDTTIGLNNFLNVLNMAMNQRGEEQLTALFVFAHMVAAGIIRLCQIMYGPFLFIKSLNLSPTAGYIASIIAGCFALITLFATRFHPAYKIFYPTISTNPAQQSKDFGYLDQAKRDFNHLSRCQISLKLLTDPTVFFILTITYIVLRILATELSASPAIKGVIMALSIPLIISVLGKFLKPAIQQKIVNGLYNEIRHESEGHKEIIHAYSLASIMASVACAFYRFSQTVSLIDTLETLAPATYNPQSNSGQFLILFTLSIMGYLSYSAYEFHQPKVAKTLNEFGKSLPSTWGAFYRTRITHEQLTETQDNDRHFEMRGG